MALVKETQTLDQATLSGGARILAAGSGLPRRITVTDLMIQPGTPAVGNNYACFFWDPDGIHLWACDQNWDIVKINATTGSIVLGPIVPPLGENAFVIAKVSDGFWVSTQTTKLYKYNFAGALQTTVTLLGGSATRIAVPTGQSTLAWVNSSHALGSVREINLTTGADTGRTFPGGAIYFGVSCGLGAHAPYVYGATSNDVRRFALSDPGPSMTPTTLAGSVTPIPDEPNSISNAHNFRGGACLDPSDNGVLVLHTGPNNGGTDVATIERFDFVASTVTRAFYAARHLPRGVDMGYADAGSQTPNAAYLAISDDGKRVALSKRSNTAPQNMLHLYVFTRTGMRARWTHAFASPATLQLVSIPGMLGNEKGISPIDGSAQLHERTKCYWSLDGGSSRTQFTPGMPLSVSIAGGQTLTIDADIDTWLTPPCGNPFIGGDAGEGITLLWDDPAATVYTPSPTASLKGKLGGTPTFKGRISK